MQVFCCDALGCTYVDSSVILHTLNLSSCMLIAWPSLNSSFLQLPCVQAVSRTCFHKNAFPHYKNHSSLTAPTTFSLTTRTSETHWACTLSDKLTYRFSPARQQYDVAVPLSEGRGEKQRGSRSFKRATGRSSLSMQGHLVTSRNTNNTRIKQILQYKRIALSFPKD